MEWGVPKSFGRAALAFAFVMIACGLSAPAYCQADVVLLLEQTPIKGGEITPIAGVHHFAPGSQVSLTANPKPGYKFVHWLGDVSDPTAASTVVYLNKAKVIIAVFEQTEHGMSADERVLPAGGGGAPGGLFPSAVDLSRSGGFSGGGGGRPQPPHFTYVIHTDPPPQVPEPATGALLLLGGLFTLARKRMQSTRLATKARRH